MNTVNFKVLGLHEYGWYAYAEDDIFVLCDHYPHEGGELYRGEFKEDKIPYLNEFKRDCPEAYDNAVKYFNSRPKRCEYMRTAEDIRKDIVEAFFNNPKLGENYIDWHTEDGECGLTLMFKNANEEFEIIIRRK